jgi:hypothetical protein
MGSGGYFDLATRPKMGNLRSRVLAPGSGARGAAVAILAGDVRLFDWKFQ